MEGRRAARMFEKLNRYIGKTVYVTYYCDGELKREAATLDNVIDYQRLELGGHLLPFVGFGTAIVEVLSMDGKTLYSQEFKEPYVVRKPEDVAKFVRQFFGDEVADQKLKATRENKRDFEDIVAIERDNRIIKELPNLVEESLPLIREVKRREWRSICAKFGNKAETATILSAVMFIILEVDHGATFEEAIFNCDKKYKTNGANANQVAEAIFEYAIVGDSFKKYWYGTPSSDMRPGR